MTYKQYDIAEFAPLVRRLALQLVARLPASVELDDLIQSGMIGLLDAFERYQQNPNAQFETYATTRIRGAMLDELRQLDWLPRSVRSKARKIEHAIQTLEQQLTRPPSEQEIANALEIDINAYHALLGETQGTQILHYEDFQNNSEESEQQHNSWLNQFASSIDSETPLDSLLQSDFRQTLIEAIDQLPDREKLLLSLYYEEELNLKEIGAVMNISEARACQLRTQATARLRAYLKTKAWERMP